MKTATPTVLEFRRVKRNFTSVRFANISVKLSDAFMRAVEQDGPWTLAERKLLRGDVVAVRRYAAAVQFGGAAAPHPSRTAWH